MDNPIKETSNFIGNNNIEEFMLNSINSNKLHHAYLLSGIKGLGKATFAYRCAKYILSDTFKENMNVDNSDKVSKLIESDSHPDFIVLKKVKQRRGKNHVVKQQYGACSRLTLPTRKPTPKSSFSYIVYSYFVIHGH